MTAAVGLYLRLYLPEPWLPAASPTAIIIYGGSSSVGAFAIKLAQASNLHPIIAVAGSGAGYVETLLSPEKGDAIVDYRKGDAAVVSGIQDALAKAGVSEVRFAYDAISEHNSYINISKVLAKDGRVGVIEIQLCCL
jgi:NADPH2:quinone reductase